MFTEEKVKCHLPNGKLHRAFTALLFDEGGRLVITRRAKEKMLWPSDWDGTFASHPRESETYVSSGERRMPEELGIEGKLDYLHKFEYHVSFKDVGSENEICVNSSVTSPSGTTSRIFHNSKSYNTNTRSRVRFNLILQSQSGHIFNLM